MSAVLAPPSSAALQLMTADEFLRLHGDDTGIELIDGHPVRLPMPGFQHAEVCGNAYHHLRAFVKGNNLGRVFSNDPFIRTRSNPDGFRGADVVYISYDTLPANQPTPVGTFTPPLELVVEVRSPSDSMSEMTAKAAEYLAAKVAVVLILDPESSSAEVHRASSPVERFSTPDTLTLPDVLPGFAVPVAAFFE